MNLDKIVTRLEETGAHLIWCSTTPVPEGSSGRIKGDADRYNEAASRVADRHGLAGDDLYSFALTRLAEIQKPANVHFTEDGSVALATHVVGTIEVCCDSDGASPDSASLGVSWRPWRLKTLTLRS